MLEFSFRYSSKMLYNLAFAQCNVCSALDYFVSKVTNVIGSQLFLSGIATLTLLEKLKPSVRVPPSYYYYYY